MTLCMTKAREFSSYSLNSIPYPTIVSANKSSGSSNKKKNISIESKMTTPASTATPIQKKKSVITRACDNCRYRKIKCDGQMPCSRCVRMQFKCAYDRPQKKKGPCGKRIVELRRQQQQSQEQEKAHLIIENQLLAANDLSSQSLVGPDAPNVFAGTIARDPYSLFSNPLTTTIPPSLPGPLPQFWPSHITEASLIPHIDTYFERLYSTIPVLSRARLFEQLAQYEHRKNPQFGSMLLAMAAFSLIQPLKASERDLYESQLVKAKAFMAESVKMRNDPDFGDDPSLELTLASFFLFACLYGTQKNNAAWFRLQEAVTLGTMLGLGDPSSYTNLKQEEVERRLRTFWVLSVTERAYALQRRHPITFRGHPAETMQLMRRITDASGASYIQDLAKESTSILGLKYMVFLFNSIDENIIECWNMRCREGEGGCKRLTQERVVAVHHALVNAYNFDNDDKESISNSFGYPQSKVTLKETQQADAYITQQWLRNRLWQLALSHGLLSQDNAVHPELRLDFAVTIARSTLAICHNLTVANKKMDALESHGIGLVEKLYDIASSVAGLLSLFPWMDTAIHANKFDPSIPVNPYAPPLHSEVSMRETLNQFLAIFAVFRGGQHPYLDPFMHVLSTLPTVPIREHHVPAITATHTASVQDVHNNHSDNWQPMPASNQSLQHRLQYPPMLQQQQHRQREREHYTSPQR